MEMKDGSPNREEPQLQTTCEPCRHNIHRLERRLLHKTGIGGESSNQAAVASRHTISSGQTASNSASTTACTHGSLSCWDSCMRSFRAAITGNVSPSVTQTFRRQMSASSKYLSSKCHGRHTFFTFPEMMQDDCQLSCICDDSLLAEVPQHELHVSAPAPQVVVPKLLGHKNQDAM